MSNFICSECGMTNIDCGRKGYKTPREIELEKGLEIAVNVLEECIYLDDSNLMRAKSLEALKQIQEVK